MMISKISHVLKMILFFIVSAGAIFTTLCSEKAIAADFIEVTESLLRDSGAASVVSGTDGWFFLKEELQHLRAGKFWGEEVGTLDGKAKNTAEPLSAIVEYNNLLSAKGIELYLMPVPPKAMVYPDKISAQLHPNDLAPQIALYSQFYKTLQENGVKVIDVLPQLLANRDKDTLYCRTDSHFSGAGLAIFAEAAAEVVKSADWYKAMAKVKTTSIPATIMIHGDLLQMAEKKGEEEVALSVIQVQSTGSPFRSDNDSPVILLGDSHTLVFQAGGDLYAQGGGLFDHLSANVGFAVDLLGVRGSGVTPARIAFYQRAKQDGGYLAGKKILVWCFAAREFTAQGWRKIPVSP